MTSSASNATSSSSAAWAGRRVLVTGASGYIAPSLCRALARAGAETTAVSRRQPVDDPGDARWRESDLTAIAATRDLVASVRPEFVFHLAGLAIGKRDLEYILPTFHSNLTTLVNVLTATTELGGCRRILIASSLEEPDAGADAAPSSPYAASKWAGSAYGRLFHSLYEAPVVLARTFMTYGPGRQDLKKLIPYTILALLEGQPIEFASGRREIDWIYVDDVAEGYLAAALATNLEGQTVDIGSGRLTSIRDLVERLRDEIDPEARPAFGAKAERKMEQVRKADVDRTTALTGWRPRIPLEEGLRRTISWYQQQVRERSLAP